MSSRKLLIYLFLTVMLIGAKTHLSALSTGSISGIITDEQTGQAIGGASIRVTGTDLATYSAVDGSFLIANVPVGTYTLRIKHVWYEPDEIIQVAVTTNSDANVSLSMKLIVNEKDSKRKLDMSRAIQSLEPVYELSNRPLTTSGDILRMTVPTVQKRRPDQRYIYPPAHGGTAIVNNEPFDAMFFKNYGVNPFVDTEDDHLSTFAIDVDDASYIMMRSYLNRGALPPEKAIRIEEFINHFDYEYDSNRWHSKRPFSIHTETAPTPFGPTKSFLLKIGIKGNEIARENRTDANLVFVVDISGSMGREDRLGLVKKSLRMLVDELTPRDRVGIVVYGSVGRVLLEPTSLDEKDKLIRAIESLAPGGSTNAEEGIMLGYKMADQYFERGKINRIILCSDGVANVGRTGPNQILKQIKKYADKGITLSAIGFGLGNYNDILLEKLGNKGNGHYAYVDNLPEAKRVFVDNLTGALQVIARDVKIQVDFDPKIVRSYRLLGYENRDVDDDKFRDDKEDGGEIGSGHEVTALYEIKLHDRKRIDRFGTVYVRFKSADGSEVDEVARTLRYSEGARTFWSASESLKLAATAAEFAEILKKSYWAKGSDLSDLLSIASDLYNETESPELLELMHLISRADSFGQLAEK